MLGALAGFLQLAGAFQLVSIVAYRLLPGRKAFWFWAHLVHRLAGFGIAAAALLFYCGAPGTTAALVAAIALGFSWVTMSVSSSGWLSWMADIIPEQGRASFFLRRSAVFQAATVTWFFVASVLLDLVPGEGRSLVYAAIFAVGAAGGAADILLHLGIPEPRPAAPEGSFDLAEFIAPLRDRNFLRYALAIGVAILGILVAAPFQAPYVTSASGLGAPNVWLGIMTVISILTWVTMAPLWGFVMDRYGRKPALLLGLLAVSGTAGYLVVDRGNYVYILPLIALVGGFFGPAFWEGNGQLMLTLAPPGRRVVYIAWYNTIIGLVSAAGPLLGGFLEDIFGQAGSPRGGLVLPGVGPFDGFRAGQVAALLLVVLAALLLRKVREGGERPAGLLLTQIATAGVFRSYASHLDLRKDSGDPRVARALRRIDGDEGELVLHEVLARLDDPSHEIRDEAVRALGRIGSAAAVEALVGILGDSESTTRVEAARALGRIGDRRALPALEASLADPSPELGAACLEALGSIGGQRGIRGRVHRAAPGGAVQAGCAEPETTEGSDRAGASALGAEAASRSGASESPEGPAEIMDAAVELLASLAATRNAALRAQYAIALGNLLCRPGSLYPYVSGDPAERSERRRSLAAELARRIETQLGGRLGDASRGGAGLFLAGFASALDEGDGAAATRAILALHGRLMEALFGPLAADPDFPEAASRADLRLGAWCAVARAATALAPPLSGEAGLLLALVGARYLAGD
jgi:hypothetical protein